ncbi:MAG TPA: hypothetical protein VGS59_08400 [Candidatus Acidoferrales bacterium]|nr:hypothetical protein [Candidatus Acidoferrales bacterium]
MKARGLGISFVLVLSAVFSLASARTTSAQAQTASVSFTVEITPSAGIAEPVRGLPVYLLRKSFESMLAEAQGDVPRPDMDKFIDSQKLSKELIAWMHKNHTLTLSGEEFAKNLTPQEIINIPEFWQAYFQINAGSKAFGFPLPKYDDRDQTRNPAKYQREVDDYHARVMKYIEQNPDSKLEMDEELDSIDPSHQWKDKIGERSNAIHRMALDWAQSRYFVRQAQTNLNGRADFTGLPAGTFWISTLDIYGQAGDTREKWDTPVSVRNGTATQVALSNYNAVPAKPLP